MIRYSFWNFNIFNQTLTSVVIEIPGVDINSDLSSGTASNKDRCGVVDLGHSFNLSENHVVTLLIRVSLVVMDCDLGLFTLFNQSNDELFGLLTIMISYHVFSSVVKEGISPRS